MDDEGNPRDENEQAGREVDLEQDWGSPTDQIDLERRGAFKTFVDLPNISQVSYAKNGQLRPFMSTSVVYKGTRNILMFDSKHTAVAVCLYW